MRLQRRKRKWHSRETVVREIKKEYAMFKSKMLSGIVHEVYGSCRRICFYESLWEYFLYSEHISRMFLEAALGKEGILEGLWEIYLKNESLRADTWDEIERILYIYAVEHTGQEKRREQDEQSAG